jgi:hypothetical protein
MLDVRLPAGLMFLVMGALLAGYGLLAGVRIDLIWGSVLIVASVCLLALAFRSGGRSGAGGSGVRR